MVKSKSGAKGEKKRPKAKRRSPAAQARRRDRSRAHKLLTEEAQAAAVADKQLSLIGCPSSTDACPEGSCESGQCESAAESITRAASLASNHCLYSAMNNCLLTTKERTAFGSGLQEHAERAFEEFVKSRYDHDKDNGYSGSHMLEYLKHLQRAGHIKSFVWKVLPGMSLQDLVRAKGVEPGTAVVLFGRATRSDVCKKVQKAILRVSAESWGRLTEETRARQIDAYVKSSTSSSNSAFDRHAAGARFRVVGGERVGEFVDGGKFTVKELSAVNIAKSMVELRVHGGALETVYRAFKIVV